MGTFRKGKERVKAEYLFGPAIRPQGKLKSNGYLALSPLMRLMKLFDHTEKRDKLTSIGIRELKPLDPALRTVNSLIEHLEDPENGLGIVDAVITDLKNYCERVREEVERIQGKPIAELTEQERFEIQNLAEQPLVDLFPHSVQVSKRLEMLEFLGSCPVVDYDQAKLGVIWDQLVTLSPFQSDHEGVQKWFKSLCEVCPDSRRAALIDFFKENIESTSP